MSVAYALEGKPWEDAAATPFVRIEGVRKHFGDFVALDGIDLDIYRGELFCLLGGSGCGKSTLLRILAGFEQPTAGRVLLDGVDMTSMPAYERPVNMMFQSYALFPHMNVEKNVAYGLKRDGVPAREVAERVRDMLALVQMSDFARRKPHQLSGGQRQRVALARSLVKRPKLLLLDEPLAALDRKLREQTQFELMNIQDQLGVTFIVVTHDQEEAMTLSTRIAVMDRGKLIQIGEPTELYERPRNRFIADFVGSVNLFEGRVDVGASGASLLSDALGEPVTVDTSRVELPSGTLAHLALRPEKVRLSKTRPVDDGVNVLEGEVNDLAYMGSLSHYVVQLASGAKVRATMANQRRLDQREIDWDDKVYLYWYPTDAVVLDS